MALQRYYRFTQQKDQGAPIVTYHKVHSPKEVLEKMGVNLEGKRASSKRVYASDWLTVKTTYEPISREEFERERFIESIAPLIQPQDVPAVFKYLSAPPISRRNRSRAMFGVYASA